MTEAGKLVVRYITAITKNSDADFVYVIDKSLYGAAHSHILAEVGKKSIEGIFVKERPLEISEQLTRAVMDLICQSLTGKFSLKVLSWNDYSVLKIARSIYKENKSEDKPVLADALEEAGFTNDLVLDHLRDKAGSAQHKCCDFVNNLFKLSEMIDY